MSNDYLEIRKNFLSHASTAGMPTNVAQKYKGTAKGNIYANVTGNSIYLTKAKEAMDNAVKMYEDARNKYLERVTKEYSALQNADLSTSQGQLAYTVDKLEYLFSPSENKEIISLMLTYLKAIAQYKQARDSYAKAYEKIYGRKYTG